MDADYRRVALLREGSEVVEAGETNDNEDEASGLLQGDLGTENEGYVSFADILGARGVEAIGRERRSKPWICGLRALW